MSKLVRLYPVAWRERYTAEFSRLLQERPLRARDLADVLLGAVDAHLHPELLGTAPQPWTRRLPGLLATGAGLIWTWYFVRLLTLSANDDWGEGVGLAVILMLCAVPGDYALAYLRQIGLVVGAIVVAMVIARVAPWSSTDGQLNLAVGVAAWLLVAVGMLTLAAIRAGVGPRGRWILLAAAVLVPASIGIPILGGFGPGDPGGLVAMVVTTAPYGVAWALLGLRMTARGSATIIEAPPSQRATEVLAT